MAIKTKSLTQCNCPLCEKAKGIRVNFDVITGADVLQCPDCGALFTNGVVKRATLLNHINLDEWQDTPTDSYHQVYFDVLVDYSDKLNRNPSENQIARVHGWYNNVTKKLVQTG